MSYIRKTDLNKIPGMRDNQFTDSFIEKHEEVIFRLTKYVYLCAVCSYIEMNSGDYFIVKLIDNYIKELRIDIVDFYNHKREFRVIARRKKFKKYPSLLAKFFSGDVVIEDNRISNKAVKIEHIQELRTFIIVLDNTITYQL